ncbi:serine/threonine-protein phosphatase [Streptomyces sp. RB6PN25]|uniref:Serine/threonine-protein phosphatase n=1 Tax=Streptomyces humicola TaxID=2953240 RepID=A0ABT1PVP9_9ACTN|nr:SpoIIE family protein phosphatase [Streptomyces humicola]MCQ4081732.1 serine/threonine-protein phosphatase [Streptomyces humicola]
MLPPRAPLGVGRLGPAGPTVDVFSFEPGDTLLLYIDGVIEARDRSGAFYPFAEQVGRWTESSPATLLHHIRRDLLAHTEGCLGDDAAIVAVLRTPAPHSGHHHFGKIVYAGGAHH